MNFIFLALFDSLFPFPPPHRSRATRTPTLALVTNPPPGGPHGFSDAPSHAYA
ncbi:hypothetical protein ACGFJC_47575 [Nonomuraea fuscirosea]|uniref:hypothetical protein n=1 Tax=Nonomuraea fuscirosea TaxID=1291556 RepID=UPI003719ED15